MVRMVQKCRERGTEGETEVMGEHGLLSYTHTHKEVFQSIPPWCRHLRRA